MNTTCRMHLALHVRDLGRSVAFYRTLLGGEPTKLRPDYARFEHAASGLVLSLAATSAATDGPSTLSHLGLRIADATTLEAERTRLTAAGLSPHLEEVGVDCCYALQDKFWLRDPDGNEWELYHLLDDAPASAPVPAVGGCCPATASDASGSCRA